jgi:hypothetical protein
MVTIELVKVLDRVLKYIDRFPTNALFVNLKKTKKTP